MRKKLEDNKLTLFLEGRVDTNNARDFENGVFEAIGEAPGAELILDAPDSFYREEF